MEIKLIVDAAIIAALKLFLPDNGKAVRILNGIAVEIGATESRLVATDGVMLGCFRVVSAQPEISEPLTNVIIPKDMLKLIGQRGKVEITIHERGYKGEQVPSKNARQVTLTCGSVSISSEAIDGEFPRYRDVIPSKVSGQPAQFDARRIGILAKAQAILRGSKKSGFVGIGFNGDSPALINFGNENFIGVIMPMYEGEKLVRTEPPTWYSDSVMQTTTQSGSISRM